MNTQAAIHIPELDGHSTSWAVVRKDTGALISESTSRFWIEAEKLNPEKIEVLTWHQYLRKSGDHRIAEIGAKDLLQQIEMRELVNSPRYINLVDALQAFLK
jgi:hypothetical protein